MSLSKFLVRCLLLSFVVLSQSGWQLPEWYQRYSVAQDHSADKLNHVILKVNGERYVVRKGETLTAVWGDRIFIEQAVLFDPHRSVQQVNLRGFSSNRPGVPKGEDRETEISTEDRFAKHWAVDADGTVFPIIATTGKILHGSIFLKFEEPRLVYADVLVNRRNRVMRDGELLILKASDKVKIDNVVTNMKTDEGITFEIVPSADSKHMEAHNKKANPYEIKFARYNKVFARIPLLVEADSL